MAKIGSIIYIIVETYKNIIFVQFIVSQSTKNPSFEHFNTINQILRYLAGSQDKGIIFKEEEKLKLDRYLDFN